jgi:hypothetical protein
VKERTRREEEREVAVKERTRPDVGREVALRPRACPDEQRTHREEKREAAVKERRRPDESREVARKPRFSKVMSRPVSYLSKGRPSDRPPNDKSPPSRHQVLARGLTHHPSCRL